MRKNTGRTMMCAFSALAVSALAGMTGMAQEESDVIAIPYEQSDAWQEIAMVNDDTVSTGINIRAAANEDSEVIGYLYNGGAAWVINKGETWTELYSGGLTGFVKNEYLMYADDVKGLADHYGKEGVATTWDHVQLFAEADGGSEILEYLETGDSFILAEDGGHWLAVQYGADDLAYLSSEDVTRVLLLDTAVAKDESYKDAGQAEETYTETEYTEETSSYEDTYTEPSTEPSYTEPSYTEPSYTETEPAYTEETSPETEYTEDTSADTVYTEDTSDDTSNDTSDEGTEDVIEDDGSYYDADSDTYYDESGNVVSEDYSSDTTIDASDYAEAEAAAQAAAGAYAETEAYVETEAPQTEAYVETEAPQTEAASSSASTDDASLLAALIYCEAGNQSYEGMVAVGAVVMNRVSSPSFPNSISEVIYQSGQFTPASSGALASALASGVPSACYEAASAALAGENPVGGALYFNTGSGQGMKIGDHQFY